MQPNVVKAQLTLQGDTIASLAEKIDMNPKLLSAKLNGNCEFKLKELARIREVYNLSPEEFDAIFFS